MTDERRRDGRGIPEAESLTVALALRAAHGARAPEYIAAQIGRLALAGDARGVARWKAVAAAWVQLDGRLGHCEAAALLWLEAGAVLAVLLAHFALAAIGIAQKERAFQASSPTTKPGQKWPGFFAHRTIAIGPHR